MDGKENGKIRVLVVDDSALMSRQITNILNDDTKIEVVGRAKDGLEALDMVESLKPDVVTLDVEMPRMNGITALKHIMVRHCVPTVMISALTTEGARATFDALKYGAIDVIAKPSRREDESLDAQKADIIAKVHRAAAIRMGKSRYLRMPAAEPLPEKTRSEPPDHLTSLIGIGTATGGYYALLRIVPALPAEYDDVILAVILVARKYLEPFAGYLEAHSHVPVRMARHGSRLEKGVCYLSAGNDKTVIHVNTDGSLSFGRTGPEANHDSGAINALFRSLVPFGRRGVGVVLTGAGKDGADGLAELRNAGGLAVVQSINNCLDPEMPLAALERGSVEKILPDYLMAEFLERLRHKKKTRA
jgi:two-component system, chemotaxis family, protein-glutamate methylesterase/glutaminase